MIGEYGSVGFTGTQDGMEFYQSLEVARQLQRLSPREFHHGVCIGADEQAHSLSRLCSPDAKIIGHPPVNTDKMAEIDDLDESCEPKEYLARNRDIVDASVILIAAPKGPEELRSGTWSTVRYARKLGKPVVVVMPGGDVEFSNHPIAY